MLPVDVLAAEIRKLGIRCEHAPSLGAGRLADAMLISLDDAGWHLAPNDPADLEDDRIVALRRAIRNEGPNPAYHRQQMARLREAWPTLAHALDAIL